MPTKAKPAKPRPFRRWTAGRDGVGKVRVYYRGVSLATMDAAGLVRVLNRYKVRLSAITLPRARRAG